MSTTARAAVITAFGDPDVFSLTDVAVADPAPGQLRVRVSHSAVNPIDLGTRQGRTVPVGQARFPMVLGWDAVGTIEAVGEGITDLVLGDRVLVCVRQAATQAGTHADLIVVDRDSAALAPSTVPGGAAAALGLAGITALQAVRALDLSSGDTVLINNAVGFVGRLAAEIAGSQGADVIGIAPTSLAAHAPAGVRIVEDASQVRAQAGVGVGAALDLVGGTAAQDAFAAVEDGGRYASVIPLWWKPGGPASSSRGISPVAVENAPNPADLAVLAALADAGQLTLTVAATFTLDQLAAAHRTLAEPGVLGKILIRH